MCANAHTYTGDRDGQVAVGLEIRAQIASLSKLLSRSVTKGKFVALVFKYTKEHSIMCVCVCVPK